MLLRAALAWLTLVVTGALFLLARADLDGRVVPPPAPPGRLHVPPGWADLGPAPPEGEFEYDCAGRVPFGVWRVRVVDGALRAQSWFPEREEEAWPYELDFAQAIDTSPPRPGGVSAEQMAWATRYAREHARRRVVPVIDGWLIGFDAGEYGGSLWWYPKVPGRGVKLAAENVRAVTVLPGRASAVVLVGLSHMGSDWGHVLRVERSQATGRWTVARTLPLRGAPRPTLETPEGILVATTRSLELVSHEGVPRVLADVSPLRLWSPAFIATAAGGEIVVGMPHLVVVLSPSASGYAPRWYAPLPCPANMEDIDDR